MDPNPIKHQAVLIKEIREALEPYLAVAGLVFDSRNKPKHPGDPIWLVYARPGMLFQIEFEQRITAALSAAILDDRGAYRKVAEIPLNAPRSTKELMERMECFIAEVITFLETLPSADPTAE